MRTVGPITVKPYRCRICLTEFETSTNHWGAIYGDCPGAWKHPMVQTVADCLEEPPAGFEKPEEWRRFSLGEIAEITGRSGA